LTYSVLYLDESYKNDVLTVGGFMCTVDAVNTIVEAWRSLKAERFHVDADFELKYTIGQSHPSRAVLDGAGWPHAQRIPAMLDSIGQMNVKIIVDSLLDVRSGPTAPVSPIHFYLDGFKWCIRRFANQVAGAGLHWVVVDMPPPGPSTEIDLTERLADLWQAGGTAAFDIYRKLFWTAEIFPTGSAPALRQLAFAPDLAANHAKHSDLLQIADVIAGCFREFFGYNVAGSTSWGQLPVASWQESNLARIAPRLCKVGNRARSIGFDLFPSTFLGFDQLIQRVEALTQP
jgi:hypothetical protein